MTDSLQRHELQQARLPGASLSPWLCSDSSPPSQGCHPVISSSVTPFSSCHSVFPSIKVFSSESAFCIRWPKYGSFSFSTSPASEYSGLISFRTSNHTLVLFLPGHKILPISFPGIFSPQHCFLELKLLPLKSPDSPLACPFSSPLSLTLLSFQSVPLLSLGTWSHKGLSRWAHLLTETEKGLL